MIPTGRPSFLFVVFALVLIAALSHWRYERGTASAWDAGAREGYEYGVRWAPLVEDCTRVLIQVWGERHGLTAAEGEDVISQHERQAIQARCTESAAVRLGPGPWER